MRTTPSFVRRPYLSFLPTSARGRAKSSRRSTLILVGSPDFSFALFWSVLLLVLTSGAAFAQVQQPAKGRLLPEGRELSQAVFRGAPVTSVADDSDQQRKALPSLARSMPASALDWQTIMTETFEGSFPTTGWTVSSQVGYTLAYWDDTNIRSYAGSWSAWCADGGAEAGVAGGNYPNNMRSWAIYGPFDLSAATDATLSFYYWNQSESGYDYFGWYASIDGNNFLGTRVSGNSGGWLPISFDLKNVPTIGNVTGKNQVWIAFLFTSDASGTNLGAFIDNISLERNIPTTTTIPSVPVLQSPSLGASGIGTSPTLSWSASAGATKYHLQVSSSSTFASFATNDSTLTSTSKSLGPLANATVYYWRVRAGNAGGWSAYTASWSFTTAAAAAGQTYYVDASNGNNATGNGSAGAPWKTITFALNQVGGSGHKIVVAAGKYDATLGESFPILIKSGISLQGAGKGISILDAGGTNVVLKAIGIGDATTSVQGFTIQGGGGSDQGGGLLLSAGSVLTISNNLITANEVVSGTAVALGAGIYILNSSPRIVDNEITSNIAVSGFTTGGGAGAYGGGIAVSGSASLPVIETNVITRNEVQNEAFAAAYGAGIYVTGGAKPTIRNNTISGNILHRLWATSGTTHGAGIFIDNSSPLVTQNRILNNKMSANYGTTTASSGLYVSGVSAKPDVHRNVIAKNANYGIWCASSSAPSIVNNTLADNTADGIYISGAAPDSIVNNILALNLSYGINEGSTSSDPLTVQYNLFYANSAGLYRDEGAADYFTAAALNSGVAECKNNVDGDPMFADLANADYRIRAGSAAINSGSPSSPLDPDGTRADIGAHYYVPLVTVPPTPTLSSPSTGSTGHPTTITLGWAASTGATKYHVQVSALSTFATIVQQDSTLTANSKSFGPFANATTYFWRVRAGNTVGWSSYSTSWNFTTIVALPPVPTLSLPANGALSQPTTLSVTWGASAGATRYHLQVSASSAFATFVLDDSLLTGTSTSVGPLANGTVFYWRVRARNAAGWSAYSTIWSFTTAALVGDPYEPNNIATSATPITYGFKTSGAELNPPGDVDYYKFTASVGDFIAIEALSEDVSELNLRISLFDATGTEVASSDIVSTGTERILYGVGRAQQYYIRVVEASDTASFPNSADGGGEEPAPLGKRLFRSTSGQYTTARTSSAATPAYTLSLAKGTPLPPLALGAGAGFNGLVPLRWLPPPSNPPIEYRVYRSTSAAGPFGLIGSTWRESFVDTTATNGTLYHYHVKSVYGATNSESGPSNVDKATPRALGFKFPSRFATVKPTMDGTLRASEWADAQADNIAIRRTTAVPPSVSLLVKNDASALYVGIIDSNASASTWNRLVLAFDSDNDNTWNKTLPSDEGFLVIDDSAGIAVVEYYGVAGTYPDVDVMDGVRNPKGIIARLSHIGSSVHYEISIDFASISPVVGGSAAMGMYVATISDEFSGEYPLQAVVLAPMTFADVVLAKPSAVVTLVFPLNASLGVSTSPTLSWNPVTGATGYRLQVATDSNFVSNIVLDQSNITGTSYPLAGLANGTEHYWRVMASVTGNVGTWSTTWRFKTILGTVSLASPPDKATGISSNPTLSWSSVKGAASYHLQVSLSSSFSTTGVDQSGLTNTTFSASGLRADTIYYWRVEAIDPGGSGGWSSTWSFRTLSSTPSTPTLSSPPNNATSQATTLTLSWAAATGATSYYLQVATNSSFASGLAFVDSALTSTSKQLTALAENTVYYWRVRGRNTGGYGQWSSTYAFTTIGTKTVTSTPVAFPSNPTASTDYRLVTFPTTASPRFGDLLTGSQYTNWRVWEENGGAVPNNLNEASAISTVGLGMGYWLLYKGTYSYSRAGAMPRLETDGTCIISVNQGVWNIIGNPFDVSVTWAAVKQRNSTTANLWSYNGTSGFQQSATMEPFKGYYFFSNTTALRIPYPFPASKVSESPPPAVDWSIQVVLQTDVNEDAENFLGIAPQSSQAADELDQEEPPVPFEQGGLSILRQNSENLHELLSADFRPSLGEGQVWRFEVTNPKRTPGKLRVLGVESLPPGLEIRLVGCGGSGNTDLRKTNEIPLQTGSEKSWFSLVVGTPSFVEQQEGQLIPKSFELFQNYPNPFNPKTAISYQLSALSFVELHVYDALGKEVAALVHGEQPAGMYQVSFDASDLPSGVYFYRLQARESAGGRSGVFVDTKKLILVK